MKMTSEGPTNEPQSDKALEELRAENAKYKDTLQQMNAELDKLLKKREKLGGMKHTPASMSFERRQALETNEQLRKERIRLQAEISHSDTAKRIADTRNDIGIVNHEIKSLEEDIKSFENLKRHQKPVVDTAKHAEEELRYLQDEHRQELNTYREEFRQVNEAVHMEDRQLIAIQEKLHKVQAKLKLGVTREQYDQLEDEIKRQAEEIEKMKDEVGDLEKHCKGDRVKEWRKHKCFEQEKTQLNGRIDFLKKTLKERDRELKQSYAATAHTNNKPVTA